MKRLLLPLLAALSLVGCQSPKEKDILNCIQPHEELGILTPNEMRTHCECAYERYKNQDGNTSKVEASNSCFYEQGLKEIIEKRIDENWEKIRRLNVYRVYWVPLRENSRGSSEGPIIL